MDKKRLQLIREWSEGRAKLPEDVAIVHMELLDHITQQERVIAALSKKLDYYRELKDGEWGLSEEDLTPEQIIAQAQESV